MPSCLNTIVTLGICPDEDASLSGFTLVQAPGISIKQLAAVANETYTNGITMAMEKKALSLIQVKNDFVGALQSNNVVAGISQPVYDTSNFNPAVSMGLYAGERGLYFHKVLFRGSLRTTYINEIQVYPLTSGETTISIVYELNGQELESAWDVTLIANQLNIFTSEQLGGFPFAIPDYANSIKVLINNTDFAFASAPITCLKGCNGAIPNACGWAEGWDGTRKVKSEGYGINIKFQCKCDFEKILCDLAPTFSGELIWLKWQLNIMQEQYRTNRFNELVIYQHEELQTTIIPQLKSDYAAKWNQLMDGLFNILKTYKDDCLSCRGVRWVCNV